MFITNEVPNIQTDETVEAIVRFYEKFQQMTGKGEHYAISKNKNKKVKYANVYHAGPVCSGNYSVRIGLPKQLKMFSGTRYGVSKTTGLPNGFEFPHFESQKQAAEFIRNIGGMTIGQFINFLKAGDGSGRFMLKTGSTTVTELEKIFA
jgi:hypothetical protein